MSRKVGTPGGGVDRGSVTDWVDVAERLRAERDYSDAVIRSLPGTFFQFTADGRPVRWNRNVELARGYSRDELSGMLLGDFIADRDRDRVLAAFAEVLERGSVEIEAESLNRDGSSSTYRYSAVRFEGDREAGVLGVGIDVTELRHVQAELETLNADLESRVAARTAELESLNADLESFCSSVSHDLRMPLTAVLGAAELLAIEHGPGLGAGGMARLDTIVHAAERMGQMIEALLALAHVSREAPVRSEVDVSALARDTVDHLREVGPARDVVVEIDDDIVVDGDEVLLRIVLENLLGNAWKFTSATSSAAISVRRYHADGVVGFSVGDNGVGFDMADAAQLFSPFRRLPGAAAFPGTGVGLATVDRIVRRHGGTVGVRAQPGRGATFTVLLADVVGR